MFVNIRHKVNKEISVDCSYINIQQKNDLWFYKHEMDSSCALASEHSMKGPNSSVS